MWTATGGTIVGYGRPALFTAPGTSATVEVVATCGAVSGAASVNVVGTPPTMPSNPVSVTEDSTLTSIAVTPHAVTLDVADGETTQSFTAAGYDQFGDLMTAAPDVTWTAAHGTFDGSTYTAEGTSSTDTVTATATVAGQPALGGHGQRDNHPGPAADRGHAREETPQTPPEAAAGATVTGDATALSVAADYGQASRLTYTWAATTCPSGGSVSFSAPTGQSYHNGTNDASTLDATFSSAGNYVFTVTIADPYGLSTTSRVGVTVAQTATTISVAPKMAAGVPPPRRSPSTRARSGSSRRPSTTSSASPWPRGPGSRGWSPAAAPSTARGSYGPAHGGQRHDHDHGRRSFQAARAATRSPSPFRRTRSR